MIKLVAMTQEEFENFLATQTESYAEGKVDAGNWKEEEALERSKAVFAELLSDGKNTEKNHLFMVKDSDESVGHLWINERENEGRDVIWIYDIAIDEEHRRKGYGEQTLAALRTFVRNELNGNRIELHVFGYNEAAINLYKKFGFDITNIIMGIDV